MVKDITHTLNIEKPNYYAVSVNWNEGVGYRICTFRQRLEFDTLYITEGDHLICKVKRPGLECGKCYFVENVGPQLFKVVMKGGKEVHCRKIGTKWNLCSRSQFTKELNDISNLDKISAFDIFYKDGADIITYDFDDGIQIKTYNPKSIEGATAVFAKNKLLWTNSKSEERCKNAKVHIADGDTLYCKLTISQRFGETAVYFMNEDEHWVSIDKRTYEDLVKWLPAIQKLKHSRKETKFAKYFENLKNFYKQTKEVHWAITAIGIIVYSYRALRRGKLF